MARNFSVKEVPIFFFPVTTNFPVFHLTIPQHLSFFFFLFRTFHKVMKKKCSPNFCLNGGICREPEDGKDPYCDCKTPKFVPPNCGRFFQVWHSRGNINQDSGLRYVWSYLFLFFFILFGIACSCERANKNVDPNAIDPVCDKTGDCVCEDHEGTYVSGRGCVKNSELSVYYTSIYSIFIWLGFKILSNQ